MANRLFKDGFYHLEPGRNGIVKLYAKAVCDADFETNGAVLSNNEGIASVERGATEGIVTVTLQDKYKALLGATVTVLDTADTVTPVMTSEDVDGVKTVVFTFFDSATGATETDPDSATLYFEITLRN